MAGTSFGGLVGAFFAAGRSLDEIEDQFQLVEQSHLYGHLSGEGPSLLGLAGITHSLNNSLGSLTFEDLQLPCALTAVDIRSCQEVILNKGLVSDAILATIALPGLFPPRFIQDWELVDGGTLDPVPVSFARRLAPKLPVVAVTLNSPIVDSDRPLQFSIPSVPPLIAQGLNRSHTVQALSVFLRAAEISGRSLSELRLQMDPPDVLIRPGVHHIQTLDVMDTRAVARLGEEAVQTTLPQLRQMKRMSARISRGFANLRVRRT